jgi:hypothetical protein
MSSKYTRPALLTAALFALSVAAQDRITDEVLVTLPSTARVGEHTLAAGDYKIRQIPSANNPRILQFIDRDGKKVETSISAIPALKNSGADSTMVELKQIGGNQYVRHIWIEGKAYGYELPVPDQMQVSAANSGVTLTGSYKSTTVQETAQVTETRREEPAAPAAAPAPTPAQPEPTPAPAPTPAPEPQVRAPEPAPQAATPAPQAVEQPQTPAMPQTADASAILFLSTGFLLLMAAIFGRSVMGARQ